MEVRLWRCGSPHCGETLHARVMSPERCQKVFIPAAKGNTDRGTMRVADFHKVRRLRLPIAANLG